MAFSHYGHRFSSMLLPTNSIAAHLFLIDLFIPSFYYEIRTAPEKFLHIEVGYVNGGMNLDKIMNWLQVMR
jgi:hypothetical protein